MQVRSMGPISEMDMVSLTPSQSFILENGEELWISSAIAQILLLCRVTSWTAISGSHGSTSAFPFPVIR
jgi:hypothetical protein